MRTPALVLALAALAPLGGLAEARGGAPPKPKPKPEPAPSSSAAKPKDCVELATTWESAVALAKAMNVPILLHAHAFASAASWDMRDNVMGSKSFMEFAVDNCVDVIVLRGIEDGVAGRDPRAATYESRLPDGKKVRYLVEFPGLTVADLAALEASRAGTMNDSGQAPFTAVIDPWTETAGQKWFADAAQPLITTAVLAAKVEQQRWHGKSDLRKDAKAVLAAVADADAKRAKGDFPAAVALTGAARGRPNLSDRLKKLCDEATERVVADAKKLLDAALAKKATDPAAARTELAQLQPRLKGTGLEDEVKAALDALAH